MKRVTKTILFASGLVFLASVAGVVAGFRPLAAQQVGASAANHHVEAAGDKIISFDVAVDGRTFVNVAERAGVSFGSGKLFPAGTLPSGLASNDPTRPVNGVASIGDWTTRGQSAFPFPPAVAPFYSSTPDFFATQYYIVEGGRTALIADGYAYFQGQNPLGALFALIGGIGAFSGAAGHAFGTPLGMNATGAPNFRITFYLQPGSVRGASGK